MKNEIVINTNARQGNFASKKGVSRMDSWILIPNEHNCIAQQSLLLTGRARLINHNRHYQSPVVSHYTFVKPQHVSNTKLINHHNLVFSFMQN